MTLEKLSGQEIRNIRTGMRMSQTRISGLIGVHYKTWGRWERENTKPSPLALEKLYSLIVLAKES